METKKEPQIKSFMDGVESLSAELLDKDNGYILFSYGEVEDGLESAFITKGKLNCLAECLYSCMKKDAMLANVVIAASNAIVQNRMIETQIQKQAMEAETTTKKKRTRKPKN